MTDNNQAQQSNSFKSQPYGRDRHCYDERDRRYIRPQNQRSNRTQHDHIASKNSLTCTVCCQSVPGPSRRSVIAIGPCDHPVCYRCCATMRVLLKDNACPICRQQINKVIFTGNPEAKFADFDENRLFFNDEYQVFFETMDCSEAFWQLLQERCLICARSGDVKSFKFDSLLQLNAHLFERHKLYTCDLCVSHLKIFTDERKYYTHKELELHRDSKNADEKAYKKHPLCELCNRRFFDRDELNGHLRRDHFSCHLCDADLPNKYYQNYNSLNNHFRKAHFLCEEGSCRDEQFTTVFRNDIDLQVHKAQKHTNRQDPRHTRLITLDLFFDNNRMGQQSRDDMRRRGVRDEPPNRVDDVFVSSQFVPEPDDFPELSGAVGYTPPTISGTTMASRIGSTGKGKSKATSKGVNNNSKHYANHMGSQSMPGGEEEFPSLSGSLCPPLRTHVGSFSSAVTRGDFKPKTAAKTVPTGYYYPPKSCSESPKNNSGDDGGTFTTEDYPELPTKQSKKKNKGKPTLSSVAAAVAGGSKSVSEREEKEKKSKSKTNESNEEEKKNTTTTKTVKSTKDVASLLSNKDFPSLLVGSGKRTRPPPGFVNGDSSKASASNSVTTTADDVSKESDESRPPPGFERMKVNKFKTRLNVTLDTVAASLLDDKDDSAESSEQQKVEGKKSVIDAPVSNGASLESSKSGKVKSAKENRRNNEQHQTRTSNEHRKPHSQHFYIPPSDVDQRETELHELLKFCLNTSDASLYDEFIEKKNLFLSGKMRGDAFYQCCLRYLKKNLDRVFSELVVLLPDIKRQNELLAAFRDDKNRHDINRNVRNPRNFNKLEWIPNTKETVCYNVCPCCQQVLGLKDGRDHLRHHDIGI